MINKFLNVFRLAPDYENRIFGLDVMRALAIIFVVMGHALMLNKIDTNYPWIKLINGVELFFVLSGFLIGGILIRIVEQSRTFNFKIITSFWIRRWFRTLPNYYLILILNVIVVYFGIIKEDFSQFNLTFFFFLQNFSKSFYGFFWESWSLSVEEWFYLLFPILLGILFLILKKDNVSKQRVFLIAILIFLLIPLVLRLCVASRMEVDQFFYGIKIVKVVIYRLDSIALGILAAFIKYIRPVFWNKSRNITFVMGIVISYTVLYTQWPPNDFLTKVFQMIFQSIGCCLLLPKFDSIKTGPKILVKTFTHISLISYSMYLLNLALVSEVIISNVNIETATEAWLWYFVYWFVVILLATLLYKYFEKPITDLREKWKFSF